MLNISYLDATPWQNTANIASRIELSFKPYLTAVFLHIQKKNYLKKNLLISI